MDKQAAGLIGHGCLHCPAFELAICRTAVGARVRAHIEQTVHTAAARRMVFRYRDLQDRVPVICDGWASRDIRIPGGGRMIMSFFLPGELMGDTALVEPPQDGFVEAITDVQYRSFARSAFWDVLVGCTGALKIVLRNWVEDKRWSDRLIVDLGRRSAEIRDTRLITRLVERLKARELVKPDAQELAFPLRHHHMADATGLSPEHVTKVLSELRRRNILAVSERTLSIFDPVALNRIAGD